MLGEARGEHANLMTAIWHVAGLLGMSPETLRVWQRRYKIDAGSRSGVKTDMAENRQLTAENAELRRANEILTAASAFFAKELLPSHDEMIQFIDQMRGRFGVEAICRVLRPAVRGFLTSRGYRVAKHRPASARQLRDELLVPEVVRLHAENYGVYGRRTMHALHKRQGWVVGRDQTERLMRLASVQGVRCSKRVFTTKRDPASVLPADLVQRRFTAPGPRRLWVADVTYVATTG